MWLSEVSVARRRAFCWSFCSPPVGELILAVDCVFPDLLLSCWFLYFLRLLEWFPADSVANGEVPSRAPITGDFSGHRKVVQASLSADFVYRSGFLGSVMSFFFLCSCCSLLF